MISLSILNNLVEWKKIWTKFVPIWLNRIFKKLTSKSLGPDTLIFPFPEKISFFSLSNKLKYILTYILLSYITSSTYLTRQQLNTFRVVLVINIDFVFNSFFSDNRKQNIFNTYLIHSKNTLKFPNMLIWCHQLWFKMSYPQNPSALLKICVV
jgi:hypothetical protein